MRLYPFLTRDGLTKEKGRVKGAVEDAERGPHVEIGLALPVLYSLVHAPLSPVTPRLEPAPTKGARQFSVRTRASKERREHRAAPTSQKRGDAVNLHAEILTG